MAYLGQASLQPYAGHILWMARQCIPGPSLYAVPRLANRPVLSRKLGWFLFVSGICGWCFPDGYWLPAGFSQPLEWAEFPLVVDAFVVLAFILMVSEFVLPFVRARLSDLLCQRLVHHRRHYLHDARLPGREFCAGAHSRCPGRSFQRPLDSRCRGSLSDAFCRCHRVLRHPRYPRAVRYSHCPVDGRLLGALLVLIPLNGTHHYVYSAIPWPLRKVPS